MPGSQDQQSSVSWTLKRFTGRSILTQTASWWPPSGPRSVGSAGPDCRLDFVCHKTSSKPEWTKSQRIFSRWWGSRMTDESMTRMRRSMIRIWRRSWTEPEQHHIRQPEISFFSNIFCKDSINLWSRCCSEIEEKLRENNSKRALLWNKGKLLLSTPVGRILLWIVQLQGQRRYLSTELSPDTHRGRPPHSSQRSGGCSRIIKEREVSWSRQHLSRTDPSRWRGRNHRFHDNMRNDLAYRRMANPVDPVLSHYTSQEW